MRRILTILTVIFLSSSLAGQVVLFDRNGNPLYNRSGEMSVSPEDPGPPIPPETFPEIVENDSTKFRYIGEDQYMTYYSNDTIEQWDDMSGNDYHLYQPTAGGQWLPRFNNASDTVSFDDSGNQLEELTFTQAQPFTVYIVAKFRSWRFNNDILDFGSLDIRQASSGGATGWIPFYIRGATGSLQDNVNNRIPEDEFCLITVVFNGSSSYLQINDNTAATGGTLSTEGATRIIISHIGIDGAFKEFLLTGGDDSLTDKMGIVQAGLNTTYSIY